MTKASTGFVARASTSDGCPESWASSPMNEPGPYVTIGWSRAEHAVLAESDLAAHDDEHAGADVAGRHQAFACAVGAPSRRSAAAARSRPRRGSGTSGRSGCRTSDVPVEAMLPGLATPCALRHPTRAFGRRQSPRSAIRGPRSVPVTHTAGQLGRQAPSSASATLTWKGGSFSALSSRRAPRAIDSGHPASLNIAWPTRPVLFLSQLSKTRSSNFRNSSFVT